MPVTLVADNILSPLGATTKQNLESISKKISALSALSKEMVREYDLSAEKITASLIDEDSFNSLYTKYNLHQELLNSYTRLERFMLLSVLQSIEDYAKKSTRGDCKLSCSNSDGCRELLSDKNTIFIFSTTKGNIALEEGEKLSLWRSAKSVASFFSNPNLPIVVSNACISGSVGVIVAKRLLDGQRYKRAIVVGADELSRFILSGFNSFKALSTEQCNPFDISRKGLNLGEAVCSLIVENIEQVEEGSVVIDSAAITNDANHISGPSRSGEGLKRAIDRTLSASPLSGQGFINPHGTATLYNDQMESIAISRAALLDYPIVPLKGYYGHTLGAAGLLEIILSSYFLKEGRLPCIPNYGKCGTEPSPLIYKDGFQAKFNWFIKLVSGFGGCNAAIKLSVAHSDSIQNRANSEEEIKYNLHTVKEVSFRHIGDTKSLLHTLFKERKILYPKFYKMDLLSKSATILFHDLLGEPYGSEEDSTALVFYNSSASYQSDADYYATIQPDNYYPSPALFVYTLPNICIGEMCIRYKMFGEGVFFVQEDDNESFIRDYSSLLIKNGVAKRVIICRMEATANNLDIKGEIVE